MRISAWIVCVLTCLSSLEARPDPGPDADHSGTGIDFSKAVDDPETGLQCVTNEASVDTLERERLFECFHKNVNICHYGYATRFKNHRVEECKDNYEKICSIHYSQSPVNETVEHCYTNLEKQCSDQVDQSQIICRTYLESQCTTKYVEKPGQKFVAATSCTKHPRQYCAAIGCKFEPGERECHNKTIQTAVDVPEESCDLVPQKSCQGANKLVPYLVPEPICEDVPREVCTFGIKSVTPGTRPLITKWCLKPGDIPVRDTTYGEEGPESNSGQLPQPNDPSGPPPPIPPPQEGTTPNPAKPIPTLKPTYLPPEPPKTKGTASSDVAGRQSKSQDLSSDFQLQLPFSNFQPPQPPRPRLNGLTPTRDVPSVHNDLDEESYEDSGTDNPEYYDVTDVTTESDLLTTNSDIVSERGPPGDLIFEDRIPSDVKPLLEDVDPDLKSNIKVAKATGEDAHKLAAKTSLARVIKHKSEESPVDKTIIIKSNPQAFEIFGVKNVPKNLLPPGSNQETLVDEDGETADDDGTLTTLGDVTSDAPPRKFANNIFEKLTDEPFDGVTPAAIPKSKTKKGSRKPKGSTASVESGENFSVEQSGATTTGIFSSNEEIPSVKESLANDARQEAKSSPELDRQGKNLVGRIVNDNASDGQDGFGAGQGNYQQSPPNSNINTGVPQGSPPRPFTGNEAQGFTNTNPGFFPTGQNPASQSNPATNSGVQSFTGQEQSYQGGNQQVDFQPHRPSDNPFINSAGPQSNYQQGQIIPLNQQNPSNDPFQFTVSPGGYQDIITAGNSIQLDGNIRTTRDPDEGHGGFKSPATLQYGFKPLTTASFAQPTRAYLDVTEPPRVHQPVSPNLMFGFRPVSGSASGYRTQSTAPSFSVIVDQGYNNNNNNLAQSAATPPVRQPQRPPPTPVPHQVRQPPQTPKKRRKRKNFLVEMLESIMRPIRTSVHAVMSGK